MMQPAAPFPAPPAVVLHAAVASSPHIVSAQEAVLALPRKVFYLRNRVMVDANNPTGLMEATRGAAAVLGPWGDALRQAFLPFTLEAFSFTTISPIKNDGTADRAVSRDNTIAAQSAVQKMLLTIQREIFALDTAPPLNGIAHLSILHDLSTVITIASNEASGPHFNLSSAAVKAFRHEAADWLSECYSFVLHAGFPWPSAHERLAIEKSLLAVDTTSPPQ
jgi:hypothetical protein